MTYYCSCCCCCCYTAVIIAITAVVSYTHRPGRATTDRNDNVLNLLLLPLMLDACIFIQKRTIIQTL